MERIHHSQSYTIKNIKNKKLSDRTEFVLDGNVDLLKEIKSTGSSPKFHLFSKQCEIATGVFGWIIFQLPYWESRNECSPHLPALAPASGFYPLHLHSLVITENTFQKV